MTIFSVAVLTAAPVGLAQDAGGAFVRIDGREALLKSVELFLNRDNIKQIHLVVSADQLEEAKRKFGANLSFSGVKLVAGGTKWAEQLASLADRIDPACTHVVVHDAARPAVPTVDIDNLLEAAEEKSAVALAGPVKATLVETDDGGEPVALHSPASFLQLQTPIAYSKAKFIEMARSNTELHASLYTILKGSSLNLRVGSAADDRLTKALIGLLPKPKIKAANNPFDEAQW